MSLLSGVFVANATPFNAKGELDLEAYDRHLAFLADSGVHGFVPCGTTGEGALVDAKERRAIISRTLELARKRGLKTVPGCGTNDTAATLDMILEARELGCDAALVVTPYYVKPTPAGLIAHYLHLADRSDFPIVLYNVPGRAAVHMSVEVVTKLLEHPRIVGIKEASGQHAHWVSLASRMDLASKAFLAGDDDAVATILSLGGAGVISASANVAPKRFVELYEHARAGRLREAFEVQKRLVPVVQAMFVETNPGPVKFALSRMGFGGNQLRLPLVPVSRASEDAIVKALEGV